jgi:hypothetical protein
MWQEKHDSQFFVLGSKDESGGCQGWVMTHVGDNRFALRLRLNGKDKRHIRLGVSFAYGPRSSSRGGCAVARRRPVVTKSVPAGSFEVRHGSPRIARRVSTIVAMTRMSGRGCASRASSTSRTCCARRAASGSGNRDDEQVGAGDRGDRGARECARQARRSVDDDRPRAAAARSQCTILGTG